MHILGNRPPVVALSALAAAFAGGACGDDESASSDTSPEAVAACQQAAAAYAALCTNDGQRTCHVAAYGTYCSAAAQPSAAAAALDCLRVNSSSDSCRTFSDPSGASACVEGALAPTQTAARAQLASVYEGLCNLPWLNQFTFEAPFALLSPAQLEAVSTCVNGAATCEDADRCLRAGPQAAIAACYQ